MADHPLSFACFIIICSSYHFEYLAGFPLSVRKLPGRDLVPRWFVHALKISSRRLLISCLVELRL